MNAEDLLEALGRKIGSNKRRHLAQFLGVSEMALYNWERKKKPLTASQLANAFAKAERAAFRRAQTQVLRPIAEFFPIEVSRSRGGVKFELFATDRTSSAYRAGLRKQLEATKGVYRFYDSRGRALHDAGPTAPHSGHRTARFAGWRSTATTASSECAQNGHSRRSIATG